MTTTTQGSEESSNSPAEPNSDSLENWISDIRTDLTNDPPDWAPGDSLDHGPDQVEGEVVSGTETVLAPIPGPRSAGLVTAPAADSASPADPTITGTEPAGSSADATSTSSGPVVTGTMPIVPLRTPPVVTGAMPVVPAGVRVATGAMPVLSPEGPMVPEEAPPAPPRPRVGRHRAPDPDDE